MKKWGRRFRLRGSYTAEAAFLLPMGIGLILFVVSCALLLHDRVMVCAWVHETAQREAFQKLQADDEEESDLRLLLTQEEKQVCRNLHKIIVTCEGQSRFLSSMVPDLFRLLSAHGKEKEEVEMIYGEQYVRLRGFKNGVYTKERVIQEGEGP